MYNAFSILQYIINILYAKFPSEMSHSIFFVLLLKTKYKETVSNT